MIEVNNSYLDIDIIEIINKLKEYDETRFYKTIDTPNNLMVCCPFHKDGHEKKPSMGIHKQTGVCHCFTCDWVGSISEMVSNYFGYDDFGRYGSRWLIQHFDTVSIEERPDVELDFGEQQRFNRKSIATNSVDNSSINFVNEEELDKYRYIHPYMYERKLTDEVIELFDVGYDKDTDCITFPVRDINGNCVFVARRATKTKYFHYPQGVEKPVYGLYEIRRVLESKELSLDWMDEFGITHEIEKKKLWYDDIQTNEIIICESIIDALTCWVYGKSAVALNGLGTEKQFKELNNFPCRKYILATDNDEAGERARIRLAKNLQNKILTKYKIPEGKKDINDLSKDEFNELQELFV